MMSVRWSAAALLCGLMAVLSLPLLVAARPQEEQVSLGEAARKAREEQRAQKAAHLQTRDTPPAANTNPNELATGSLVIIDPPGPISLGEAARRAREEKRLALKAPLPRTEGDPLIPSRSRLSPAPPGRLGISPRLPKSPTEAPKDPVRASDPAPIASPPSKEEALKAGRAFLQQENFGDAIRVLEGAQKDFSGDVEVKAELGRAYLYDGRDDSAVGQFTEVLRQDPSHRMAKLLMARALGYQSKYEESDRLYRELIQSNPADEVASIGLIRNLLREDRIAEARWQVDKSLAHHPKSPQLREYRDVLAEEDATEAAKREEKTRLQMAETYFADSGGNHSWRSSQSATTQFGSRVNMRVQAEQHLLWRSDGLRADLNRIAGHVGVKATNFLAFNGGGGEARFSDRRRSAVYDGEMELHAAKPLWISAGFSRVPIYQTAFAAQAHLLAEGWHARLLWNPRLWRVNASWASRSYSDGNHEERESLEVLRWKGSSRLAFAVGYRGDALHFRRTLNHGYFNPDRYQSHLGTFGVNFGRGRRFRAEYLARAGVQSISPDSLRPGWELSLRNRFSLTKKWELGGDYYYLGLTQSTGAFTSQGSLLSLAYRFF